MLEIPTLPQFTTGSDKQITWAHTIRQQLATWVAAELETRTRIGQYTAEMGVTPDMMLEAQQGLNDVFGVTDATFWIDGRDKGVLGLLRALYRLKKHRSFAEYDNIALSLQAFGL